jgi:hypothetical protein
MGRQPTSERPRSLSLGAEAVRFWAIFCVRANAVPANNGAVAVTAHSTLTSSFERSQVQSLVDFLSGWLIECFGWPWQAFA